jgi:hypothetical protein
MQLENSLNRSSRTSVRSVLRRLRRHTIKRRLWHRLASAVSWGRLAWSFCPVEQREAFSRVVTEVVSWIPW